MRWTLERPTFHSPWVWNDVCDGRQNNRPTPDVFNPDHVYQFPFVAQSETQSFHFQDTGGCGNNCGGINFGSTAPRLLHHPPTSLPKDLLLAALRQYGRRGRELQVSDAAYSGFSTNAFGQAEGAGVWTGRMTSDTAAQGDDGDAFSFSVLFYVDAGGLAPWSMSEEIREVAPSPASPSGAAAPPSLNGTARKSAGTLLRRRLGEVCDRWPGSVQP